jgi:ADP-heptose:LPS heptosyltransferase
VLANPRRILLVRQNERLGNIVLLNSAISALKNHFPSGDVDLLLPAKYAGIMKDDRRISNVFPVYKKEYISMPWKLFKLIKSLRGRDYDLAIDCSDVDSHSSTAAAYALLSGARVKAGWKSDGFFDLETQKYEGAAHASAMYLELLSGIFKKRMTGNPFFEVKSGPSAGGSPIIGINCGGRDNKKWPVENLMRLGEILSNKGYVVEFISGPDEEEERKYLSRNLPPRCSVLPLIPIARLKSVFSKYSAFVSSDTGPMHVAWCLKIPVVAIFISSDIEKYKPLSDGSVVIDGRYGIRPESVSESVIEAVESKRISV